MIETTQKVTTGMLIYVPMPRLHSDLSYNILFIRSEQMTLLFSLRSHLDFSQDHPDSKRMACKIQKTRKQHKQKAEKPLNGFALLQKGTRMKFDVNVKESSSVNVNKPRGIWPHFALQFKL